jgi:hypothetical protein
MYLLADKMGKMTGESSLPGRLLSLFCPYAILNIAKRRREGV